jgi:chemotaxis protein CheD
MFVRDLKPHVTPSRHPVAAQSDTLLVQGQWHFGPAPGRLRTLLGSCVGVTLWHPRRRLGGMCHYLLPDRRRQPGAALDARYGDEAIELLAQAIARTGARPNEFIAHLYGGADTMPDRTGVKLNIGERNIERGFSAIDQLGLQLEGVDVGDNVPRTVMLDLATGEVHMRRGNGAA